MSRNMSFDFSEGCLRNSKNTNIRVKPKQRACGIVTVPHKNQILAKVSHVNEAMLELNSEVYDHKDKEECHFLRILRIGAGVQNKSMFIPGKLVIVHKSSGQYLEQVSQKFEEEYWLIKEDDILAVVDL